MFESELQYDEWWYGKVVNDTGDHYLLDQTKCAEELSY